MRCKKCKNKISDFAKYCPYCKTEVFYNEDAAAKYLEQIERNPFQIKERRKLGEFHFGRNAKAAVACVLLAASMLGYTYYEKVNAWKINEQTIFYEKEDQLIAKNLERGNSYVVSTLLMEEDSIVGQSEINYLQNQVFHYDKENDYIYYLSDVKKDNDAVSYSIYKKDSTNKNKKAICIAEDVYTSLWVDDGLYYTVEEERLLHYYNGAEEKKLDLAGVINMSYNDEHNILIVQASSDTDLLSYGMTSDMLASYIYTYNYSEQLYVVDCSNNTITKVFGEYNICAIPDDLSAIYYLENSILYEFDITTFQKSEIATNVRDFVYVNSETDGGIYYIRYECEEHLASEFYVDEYRENDELTSKSEHLQELETAKEKQDRANRDIVRESVKNSKVYFYDTTLYWHTEGEDKAIGKDVSEFYYSQRSVDKMPACYKIVKDTISFRYEDVKDNPQLNDIDYSMFYDYGEQGGIDCWTEMVIDYDQAESREDAPYISVCLIEDFISLYHIEDGKETEETSEEPVYVETLDEVSVESSSITVGDIEYHVEGDDYWLVKVKADDLSENVYDLVEGYKILEDGSVLVRVYNYDKGEYDLLHINGDDVVTVDTNVEGIYGVNSWNYYNSY